MALIIEQLDLRRGSVERRIVVTAGLTIGRALDSALVVDDPHVDVRHAQVGMAVDGLVLEDLGSINGITLLSGERTQSIAMVPGARFHLGRTAFRVVDSEAGLAPAVPLDAGAAPRTTEFESAFATTPRWYDKAYWQVGASLAGASVFGVFGYLMDDSRTPGSSALGLALASLLVIAFGAGFWALVARLQRRRAAFRAQVAVVSVVWLMFAVESTWTEYLNFFFPGGTSFISWMSTLVGIAIAVWSIYVQLGIATALSRRRRLISSSLGIASLALIVFGFSLLADDDAFSSAQPFNAEVKLVPAAGVPATDIAGFRAALAELRQDVDSLKSRGDVPPGR